ncbi:MAG: NAD(P)H-dependent oxidoreductase [Actinomycetota bacterium]
MSRVLVVFAHPGAESLNREVLRRVTSALEAGRHDVRVRDLYAEGFDSRLSRAEKQAHFDAPETKPQLASHFADLVWCEALVLVHPTWWGQQPAILKGWFDRVWAHGVAWDFPEGATRLRPRLRNIRRLITITTHGSPWYVNAVQGMPGKRLANRGLRVLCHPLCRTTWIARWGLDRENPRKTTRFFRRIDRTLRRL